tara:strand:- start:384 stop:872 length:489 start_codon:yes stop_codon:yes gene_type:complete
MKVIWKNIKGYGGVYKISNMGRVKSLKTNWELLLKGNENGRGYYQVRLYLKGKAKTIPIHKYMQETFNMGEGTIDHINGNKTDNRLVNLRVVTQRENMQNRKCHRDGKLVGTTFSRARGYLPTPWQSKIVIKGRTNHLGYYATEQLAHNAYMKAFKEIPTES